MKQLTELSVSLRDQALQRFKLLRPHLEDSLPLRVVAEDARITFRTAQRWVAQYHKHGLMGLVRRGRQDRGWEELGSYVCFDADAYTTS